MINKPKRLKFSMLNLLLVMMTASALVFTVLRETRHRAKQAELQKRILELESTDEAELQRLNVELLNQIKAKFEANR